MSRFADLYEDMRGDQCLPRRLTRERLLEHITVDHDGCEAAVDTADEAWSLFARDAATPRRRRGCRP